MRWENHILDSYLDGNSVHDLPSEVPRAMTDDDGGPVQGCQPIEELVGASLHQRNGLPHSDLPPAPKRERLKANAW